jgi:hypothetical protein
VLGRIDLTRNTMSTYEMDFTDSECPTDMNKGPLFMKLYSTRLNPSVTSGTYMSHFKSAGITVSHIFSMLPSTLKYLYSVEPVRMHFPAKHPCTNDTVCNAVLQHVVWCSTFPLVTSGAYMSHSQRVFSSPLG